MFSASNKLQDFTQWKKIVSPAVDKKTPFFRWYLYKHGYSRELVQEIIKEMKLKEGQSVLDPFCGGGTTLLAAAEKGLNATGYDIMPFSAFVSNTKLLRPDVSLIEKYEKNFTPSNIQKIQSNFQTDITTLNKAFDTKTMRFLFKFRKMIDSIDDKDARQVMLLSFLKNLESIGRAKKTGGFLRIDKESKNLTKKQIVDKFRETLADIKEDLRTSENKIIGKAKAFVGDSRNIPSGKKFDALISSPPYPNRHDYTRVYLLEEVFGFGDDNKKIKQIRYNTLRSHVEARKQFETDDYERPKKLETVLEELSTKKLNNENIIEMIDGFFEDMHITLKSVKKILNKNGQIGLVMSNARYAGVAIESDKYLLEIGKNLGLEPKGIYVLRHRGNSYQQTVRFNKDPARESLVIWSN